MSVIAEKSRLQELLEKNAYGDGLSLEERLVATELIRNPELSTEECWVCKMHERQNKAIFDTRLCSDHAYYALVTRK